MISYTGEEWRLGTSGRADRLDFQISTDATSLTTGTWTDVDTLDFNSPITTTVGALDGNAAANRTMIMGTVPGLMMPNGATFWIRWNDLNATGADDGLWVDDFCLTPNGVPTPTPTKYPNKHTDDDTDKYADEHTDEHSDGDADKYTDEHADEHADKYSDGDTDKYTDEHSDEYTDKYSDGDANEYTHEYSNEYTDKYADEHTD